MHSTAKTMVPVSGILGTIHADMEQQEVSKLDLMILDRLHPTSNLTAVSMGTNYEPTVDGTVSETASELSSYSDCDNDVDCGDEDSNDDENLSTQSDHSNISTRTLLKQAQRRLRYQSICEEVEVLRAELVQYKQSLEIALRQKMCVKDKCNVLENQLDQLMETIHDSKKREQKWIEETSQRERDFMNQINDLYSDAKAKEHQLIGEITKRDKLIVEMQNLLNVKEKQSNLDKHEICISMSIDKKEGVVEFDMDDDSWSDGSSCQFV